MLPPSLVDALPRAATVVEVGVGGRFDVAADLRRRRPDVRIVVTDIDAGLVAGAPEGVTGLVEDVTRPTLAAFAGAVLVYAVRPGEEVQPALHRLARALGATLALCPLADELVAAPPGAPATTMQGPDARTWHVYRPR